MTRDPGLVKGWPRRLPPDVESSSANSRVGLFLKSDSTGGGAAQLDYLTVTREPSTMALVAFGALGLLRRRRK
jgi:hypothetical protein